MKWYPAIVDAAWSPLGLGGGGGGEGAVEGELGGVLGAGTSGGGVGGDGEMPAVAIVSEHLLVMATAPYPLACPPQSSTVALLVGMVTSTSVMLLIL